MGLMRVEIVTPERPVMTDEVDEIVLPGALGEFGVLPGHTTFLTELGIGRLAIRKGTSTTEHQISGGFCEVCEDRVIVLADSVN